MAITDILARISTDATAEAVEIVGAAEAEAARIIGVAEATVAAERKAALEAAERAATNDAATLLANARLAARDALLAQKRAMAEGVLERAREALEALPDDEYLEFIGTRVAQIAAGGETLAIAAADAPRLAGLAARLGKLGVDVKVVAEPAPMERGVLLAGDRVHAEVSPAALTSDHRDELLLVAAGALFGERE